MLFKGTAKRKADDIRKEIKKLGGIINASTGLDIADYFITVPKEYVNTALEIMEDILFHSVFDEKEFEKERNVILKEMKLRDDEPASVVMQNLWMRAFLDHSYKNPVIGHRDLFENIKREELINYYNTHYSPDNIVIAVVGDVDTEGILDRLTEIFGKYKRRGYVSTISKERQQINTRHIIDYAEMNMAYFAMAYHTVELTNQDLYALDVLGMILGQGKGSRLYNKLVREKKLLLSVSAANYTPRYPGLFIIYGTGKPENIESAFNVILSEVKSMMDKPPEQHELDAAKNMVISDYIDTLETTAHLAKAVAHGEFFTGSPLFFKDYVENIKKVTASDVREVCKKYLNERNLTVSQLLPSGYVRQKPQNGEIVYSKPPEKMVLGNGLTIILKQERRLPKIAMVFMFRGGLRSENVRNNGISNLTSSMLLKGTSTRREEDITVYIERKGGEMSHFSGLNTFGIKCEFLSKDTEEIFDILEDVIKNPVFPEKELKKEKDRILQSIYLQEDDIYFLAGLSIRKNVFAGHPYSMRVLGEPDSIKPLAREDLLDFYEKFCAADNLVISVVGDFDVDEMRRRLKKHFQNFRKGARAIKKRQTPRLHGIKEVTFNIKRKQSIVSLAFNGPGYDSEDRYAVSLLCSLLSGSDGRLFKIIRDRLGLAYTSNTYSVLGIDGGYIASYIATDKTHLEDAKNVLKQELGRVSLGEISTDEIELAKKGLIGKHYISLQSFIGLAYRMAIDEVYGIGYNAFQKYDQKINELTRQDIVNAAGKYIDMKNHVMLTVVGDNDR